MKKLVIILLVIVCLTGVAHGFRIDHPDAAKSTSTWLFHSFVEAPTAGENIYRYEVEATTDSETIEVDLPDYYQYLNENSQVWVSPQNIFADAYAVVNSTTNKVEVTCEKPGVYNVLIIGTRKDDTAINHWWQGAEVLKEEE